MGRYRFDPYDAPEPVAPRPANIVRPAYRIEKPGEYRPPAQMVANARFQPKTTAIRPGKTK